MAEKKRRHEEGSSFKEIGRRPISDGAENVQELCCRLEDLGLKMEEDSPLDAAFGTLARLEGVRGGELKIDSVPKIARAMGVSYLVDALTPLLDGDFGKAAQPHLRLLCSRGAVGAQNVKGRVTDAATKKLYELFVGMLAYKSAGNVELEDPEDGRPSSNPDVLFDLDGVRWGIACKTLNTLQPRTLVQRIREGVEQIANSEAHRGIVFVNPQQVVPYDQLMTHNDRSGTLVPRVFTHASVGLGIVDEFVAGLLEAADTTIGAAGWRDELGKLDGGQLVPKFDVAALVFTTQVALVVTASDGRNAWQLAHGFHRLPLFGEIDSSAASVLDRLKNSIK